jgi:hypothetical protein
MMVTIPRRQDPVNDVSRLLPDDDAADAVVFQWLRGVN